MRDVNEMSSVMMNTGSIGNLQLLNNSDIALNNSGNISNNMK